MFSNWIELINTLIDDQKIREKLEDSCSISVLRRDEESIQDRNAIFMWTQLFVEILVRMHHKTSDRKELIEFLKSHYEGNNEQMKMIREFEETYKSDEAIRWYTRESCFHRIMNKALRVQDYGLLINLGFLIADIAKQIKHEYENFIRNHPSREGIHVYRGQSVSQSEFKLITTSIDEYLSMNSFISTSRNRKIALSFARQGANNNDTYQILFEIEIDTHLAMKPFADASTISDFREYEIIINLGALFRIKKYFKDTKENIHVIRLSLARESDFDLIKTFVHMKEKIGHDPTWNSLGKILVEIGEYDQANECYSKMRINTNIELYNLYIGLGSIQSHEQKYDNALELYLYAFEIQKKIFGEKHPDVASTYRLIGTTYLNQGKTSEAWEYYKSALDILQNLRPPNHVELSRIYHAIALWYQSLGKYDSTLSYYYKALNMQRLGLPPDHPDIALIHNDLGSLYELKDEYETALECYKTSLGISKKVLLPDHEKIRQIEENIKQLKKKMGKDHVSTFKDIKSDES